MYTLALSRDRLNQKSTKTLGAKKRSQKDLFIKKSAIKTIKHQYRSQAILGFWSIGKNIKSDRLYAYCNNTYVNII